MKVTREHIEALFEQIMSDLGHGGWTLEWTTDEYCWHRYKRIDLNYESDEVEMVLIHEIAHIDVSPDKQGNWHTAAFYDHMDQLAQQYLGREIGEHDWYRRDLAEHRAKEIKS